MATHKAAAVSSKDDPTSETTTSTTTAAGSTSVGGDVSVSTGDTNVEIDWKPWTQHFDRDEDDD